MRLQQDTVPTHVSQGYFCMENHSEGGVYFISVLEFSAPSTFNNRLSHPETYSVSYSPHSSCNSFSVVHSLAAKQSERPIWGVPAPYFPRHSESTMDSLFTNATNSNMMSFYEQTLTKYCAFPTLHQNSTSRKKISLQTTTLFHISSPAPMQNTDISGLMPPSHLSSPPKSQIHITTPASLFSHQRKFQMKCCIVEERERQQQQQEASLSTALEPEQDENYQLQQHHGVRNSLHHQQPNQSQSESNSNSQTQPGYILQYRWLQYDDPSTPLSAATSTGSAASGIPLHNSQFDTQPKKRHHHHHHQTHGGKKQSSRTPQHKSKEPHRFSQKATEAHIRHQLKQNSKLQHDNDTSSFYSSAELEQTADTLQHTTAAGGELDALEAARKVSRKATKLSQLTNPPPKMESKEEIFNSPMYLQDDAWNTILLQEPSQVSPVNPKELIFNLNDLQLPSDLNTEHSLTLLTRVGIPKRILQEGEFRSLPLQEYRSDFLGAPYEYTQFSFDERECVILHQEAKSIHVEHALSLKCISTRISTDKTFVQVEVENLTSRYSVKLLDLDMHLYDSKCLKSVDMTPHLASRGHHEPQSAQMLQKKSPPIVLCTDNQTEPSSDQISLTTEVGDLYQATRVDSASRAILLEKPVLRPGERYVLMYSIDPIHGYKPVEKKKILRDATSSRLQYNLSPNTPFLTSPQPSASTAYSNDHSPNAGGAGDRRSTILAIPAKLGSKLKRNLLKGATPPSRKRSLGASHARSLSGSPSVNTHGFIGGAGVPKPPKILSNVFEYESRIEVEYGVRVDQPVRAQDDLNEEIVSSPQTSLAETTCSSSYFARWMAVLPRGLIIRVRIPNAEGDAPIVALEPFLVELWIFNYSGHAMDLIFTVPTESDSKFICQDTQNQLGIVESGEVKRLQLRFVPVEEGLYGLNAMYLVDRRSKDEFICPNEISIRVHGRKGGN